jgi:hypothetical protein
MRCPKCGFISFDHLASCAKCGRDISEVASELQGTSIKVEAPMFLGGALAALSESEESFEDHAIEADGDEGIDFDMEMEADEEEAGEMTAAEEDVDFSFEKEAEEFEVAAEEADIGLAEPEAEEAVGIEEETEEAADFEIEAEAEEKPELEKAEDSFEELDFMGAADDEEEGGLEFDLEDFMEDTDDDKPEASATEDKVDIDLDLGDEKN